jgi:hypothetical protein
MIQQLFALFCFGVVVSFIVFLGILRAREFKNRETIARSAKSTVSDRLVNPNLQPVAVKRSS